MARIAGVDIPPQKRVVISLMYITGIGRTTAEKLVKTAGVNPDTRVKDLTDDEVTRLRQIVDKMSNAKELLIEGDLLLAEVLGPGLGAEVGGLDDLARGRAADAVDVHQ